MISMIFDNENGAKMRVAVCLSLACLASFCHGFSTPYGETARNVATQVLQGAGPAKVDMNIYNLDDLETIAQEWTANLVQKAAENKAGVFLGAKSDREIFVDQVTVLFPRRKYVGLGIELVEIAGGREDGLGITLVRGLVAGGSAEESEILPGDSIVEVSIIRRNRATVGKAGLEEAQEEFSVPTECLSYDATVDAITSLPAVRDECDEFYQMKLKRLRRKPKVTVKLQYPKSQNEPDATLELFAGENLRHGMLLRGVKLNDPLAKRFDTKNGGNCGAGGLCRTCVVSVLKGSEQLNPQKVAEKKMLEDSPRWRLACKAIVGFGMQEGEMTIQVNPRQWD
jgi:ferredoxin